MTRKLGRSVVSLLVGVAAASPPWGNATDLVVPCWRGRSSSTFQEWRFGSSASPAAPDLSTNAYGTGEASIVTGPFGTGWLAQLPGMGANVAGYWDLGRNGTMTLNIPNRPGALPNSAKFLSVQITQWYDGAIFGQFAAVSIPGATALGVGRRQIVDSVSAGGGWWVDQTLWRVEPSPNSETITITSGFNGSVIDSVIVDTLSVEGYCPGNLVLLADAGQCSKSNVTWALPPVDGCVVTNVACTPTNGSTFPVGVTSVNCVIAGSLGASLACAFTVKVQETPAPLSIRRLNPANDSIEICWNATCVSNILEHSAHLGPMASWTVFGPPPQLSAGRYCVATNASEAMRFFRLRSP